jgi:hypothetical protein
LRGLSALKVRGQRVGRPAISAKQTVSATITPVTSFGRPTANLTMCDPAFTARPPNVHIASWAGSRQSSCTNDDINSLWRQSTAAT